MSRNPDATPAGPVARANGVAVLMLGAIGIVFGDIGTSPLYAIRETFAGPHPLPVERPYVLGALSLVFWAVMLVVSVKYVALMMRADNRGEGGSLVLHALIDRAAAGRASLTWVSGTLGVFAAALFYGDSMITPAISVLSAVEGLEVAIPHMKPAVVPLAIGVLAFLFGLQRSGSTTIGGMFGPIMVLWFSILAALGIAQILRAPDVLWAISPHYAVAMFLHDGWRSFLALGSVVLVVTGAEALYADMGHFGRFPIRLAWYGLVLPALMINYMGQGALLLSDPSALANPFFRMAPDWAALPLVGLATAAAVIASQAVISGAFSVTHQAIQLGYLPGMRSIHTSAHEIGQIYIPALNWSLMVAGLVLVAGFGTSSALAAAYGVAVTGTMLIDTILIGLVMTLIWRWRRRYVLPLLGLFAVVDLGFFLANAMKIPYGGWFPLVFGIGIFAIMSTWKQGRAALARLREGNTMSIEDLMLSLSDRIVQVPGTAVFITRRPTGVPISLLHNLKHNKVLHEQNILLNVVVKEIPHVDDADRVEARDLGHSFRRLVLNYGFMDSIDVPRALANAREEDLGFFYEPMAVSYFLSRDILMLGSRPTMPQWRRALFMKLARGAPSAIEYFELPSNRVIELGSRVEI